MILEGLKILLVGMGTVYVFLFLLLSVMIGTGKILGAWVKEAPAISTKNKGIPNEHVAAIGAAIALHRKDV